MNNYESGMCSKNTNSFDDEYANDRADAHKRLMREQRKSKREGWDGKKPTRKGKPQSDVN